MWRVESGDSMYSNNKFLIIIRYLSMVFLIVSIKLYPREKIQITLFGICIFIIFLIVGQLRFFYFHKRQSLVLITLILEVFIAIKLNDIFGGIYFLYFTNIVLDSSILLCRRYSIGIFIMLMTYMGVLFSNHLVQNKFETIIVLFFIGILGTYIKEEVNRKTEAQKLYDKLRVSQESLKKANEDLESYSNTIQEVTLLRERNRLSREPHDSVGHSLSAIIFQLGAIEKLISSRPEKASAMTKNIRTYCQDSLQELRLMVRDLKPKILDTYEGLLAIEELVRNFTKITSIKVNLRVSKKKYNLNADQCAVLYRVVQEFMTNSVKHGHASLININVTFNENEVYINLKDNGVGCSNINKSFGLQGIQERIKSVKGQVALYSEKNKGFELIATIPKGV